MGFSGKYSHTREYEERDIMVIYGTPRGNGTKKEIWEMDQAQMAFARIPVCFFVSFVYFFSVCLSYMFRHCSLFKHSLW